MCVSTYRHLHMHVCGNDSECVIGVCGGGGAGGKECVMHTYTTHRSSRLVETDSLFSGAIQLH